MIEFVNLAAPARKVGKTSFTMRPYIQEGEDRHLLIGNGRYIDDRQLADMMYRLCSVPIDILKCFDITGCNVGVNDL